MIENDPYDHNIDDEDDQGSGTSTGSGGVGGKINFRFHDAAALPPRDDALSPTEIKRLLLVHADLHKERVDKQKATRKERAALKEGKVNRVSHQQGYGFGSGGHSKFKNHPISNKAQFSGIDRQTSSLPNNFDAETNMEMQEKLENRLENRLQNVPKFNPKPRPA